jgi:enamine deaminase RidA (YjgF/YER057c/UK114 family)
VGNNCVRADMLTKQDCFDVRSLERGNCKEYWINSIENHTEGTGIIRRLLEFLKSHDAEAVSMRFFGSNSDIKEALRFVENQNKDINLLPLSILQDGLIDHAPLNIQAHAISGPNLTPLFFEGILVGHQFEDSHAKYYMLNLLPDDEQVSGYDQTKNIFEKSHKILQGLGANFSDTIRTWLFARDILSWYGDLNKARNQFFEQHNIYNKLIPASTGVGVVNVHNKALVTNIMAIKAKASEVTTKTVNSRLQGQATEYKSSFSRAVKLITPDSDRLYISGTASIDKKGKTVFINDTSAQIEMTMQVVKAILNNADMDWKDTVSSLAYFKHRKDFVLFDDYCMGNGIKLPHIKVQADVCRDNLLFELELDAIVKC